MNQAEDKKRQNIENYFRNIEQCLRDTAKQLKDGQIPHDKWEELKVYADKLPNIIVDEIGQDKANEISRLLKITASKQPDHSSIPEIEAAAGKFKGLVVIISTGHKPLDIKQSQRQKILLPIPLSPSRRNFISTGVGTSVGLTTGWLVGQNVNLSPINWKMVSFLKENAQKFILYKAPQMICDRVREMTQGGFNIEIDKNDNQKIDTQDILKNVSNGNIQCGYSGIYYNDERYKVLFFGCAIPFGLTPQEQTAWLLYKKNPDDVLTFIQQIYSTKLNLNVIPFPAAATGGQMGGWFNREVNTVTDFKGIKMRIPGLGGEVLQKYFEVTLDKELPGGAIPIDQIADELKQDNINAAEWVGPYDDFQLGLHNVAKYYYYPGWWEPSTTFDILVNRNAWEKLPKEYQRIFQTACLETYTKLLAEYDTKNSEKLQELRRLEKIGKIRLVRFSNEILQVAQKKTDELLTLYSSNATFKEVYDEWSSFKIKIRDWSNLNKI
ncbi:TRAP transporter substrate-binding protein [Nostoc piscinale]|uniref:TRAP transporter substrate-binding protein n=1 Tax=Nostoc piscinale TaxID=224012 RepID=UPI001F2EFF34|nr:ABC transporter substrate-binding protein [Nostoc piscinale]